METFNNIEKYKQFLNNKINTLLKDETYNLFIHQVFLLNSDDRRIGGLNKSKLILNSGLYVNKYPSIFATVMPMGDTNNFDIDKIVKYSYIPTIDENFDVYSIILAIPKNIKIDSKILDFSSLNKINAKYLNKIRFNQHPDSQYVMHNILDLTKKFDNLPKEFCLCMQHVNLKNNTFECDFNDNAFCVIPLQNQQIIMNKYRERFLNIINNSECKNFQELLLTESNKWHELNDRYLDDEI